jgi:hypothetical protein
MDCPCCQRIMAEAQFFDLEKIEGLIEANRRTVLKTEDDRVCAH